ncbi:MAG: hypothetical protein IH609_06695 [Dehalococcoidia bacterium]|nr:hypothetical protein [Dehalococcoidia bacterium]
MRTPNLPFNRLLGLCATLSLLTLAVSCGSSGGDGTEGLTLSSEATAPEGWEEFDYGAISGAAPPGWDTHVYSADEFVELSKQGLSGVPLNPSMAKVADELKASDLTENVLWLGHPNGFPNVNVQPCYPGGKAVATRDAEQFVKVYEEELGLKAEVVGEVAAQGGQFAIFKVGAFGEFDTYQALIGRKACASIATLATEKGDTAPMDDFEAILGLLKIAD